MILWAARSPLMKDLDVRPIAAASVVRDAHVVEIAVDSLRRRRRVVDPKHTCLELRVSHRQQWQHRPLARKPKTTYR
jgi:hypothetical protein